MIFQFVDANVAETNRIEEAAYGWITFASHLLENSLIFYRNGFCTHIYITLVCVKIVTADSYIKWLPESEYTG